MTAIPVNVQNFNRAETDLMFSRLAAPCGVGQWNHSTEVTPLDKQPVIRQNRDTLYSITILDVREDVTLTLPDTGDRYISAFVINQKHFGQTILSEPGEHVLTRSLVGSDYAGVIVRILVDPADPADVAEVNRLQNELCLRGGGSGTYPMPDYEEASQTVTRTAILELASGVSKYDHAFGTRDEVDPVLHLLGTASGWGGLPEYEATYISVNENLPVEEYRLTLKDIPVDAFWSVSLYNAAGYFEENALGVNSINSLTATPDADGGVTIRFGVHVDGVANALQIMPGWNYVLRLYRPHPSVLDGSWTAPRPEVI
ncbi:uncharacterized protein DUF1254 [Leucobacter luti]|uniref:Uncharacterized protein DUF1254 n=1 Tax=Leucobacter luti TaxID=340320 RepID=A0A4R6RUI5_9MICO|nr:DUF1214 domain-containing protein [Leucobacter luti]TDP89716.1 uncharacterized protein DUF1254 [Leucobacter luti]